MTWVFTDRPTICRTVRFSEVSVMVSVRCQCNEMVSGCGTWHWLSLPLCVCATRRKGVCIDVGDVHRLVSIKGVMIYVKVALWVE
jgi:hypothetical protein